VTFNTTTIPPGSVIIELQKVGFITIRRLPFTITA
jgi:hypothetical protein